jgi:hypothetical protein
MTIFSKTKAISCLICLNLSALFSMGIASCPSKVQSAPPVILWQINGSPHMAYGCWTDDRGCVADVQTGKPAPIGLNAQMFTGAQMLMADDFQKMTAYWDYLIQEAERRCK